MTLAPSARASSTTSSGAAVTLAARRVSSMPRSFNENLSARTRTPLPASRDRSLERAQPRRQHPVLNKEQGDLVLCGGKLLREITAEARVVGVERVARLDQ